MQTVVGAGWDGAPGGGWQFRGWCCALPWPYKLACCFLASGSGALGIVAAVAGFPVAGDPGEGLAGFPGGDSGFELHDQGVASVGAADRGGTEFDGVARVLPCLVRRFAGGNQAGCSA